MPTGRVVLLTLLALLLAVPSGFAGAPANHDSAQSADGQDLTDLALDPTGLFAAAVVNYAATSTLPGTCLPGVTCPPTSQGHKDVYACDFGASSQGCLALAHTSAPHAYGLGTQQAVDATSFGVTGGLSTLFAVAGPGDLVSLWSSSGAAPVFEKYVPDSSATHGVTMTTVAIAPDGKRIYFAGNTTAGGPGTLYLYDNAGTLLWSFNLVDGQDNPTRATSLAFARSGTRLVIGTPAGLGLFVPSDDGPRDLRPFHFFNTSTVNDVAVSADGLSVAAATEGYTYFLHVDPATRDAQRPVFSRNTGATTTVALSRDGEYFASAAGAKISFFRALHNSAIAEFVGDYTASATVTDLAYDATGRMLVAVSGNNVLGFTPGHTNPAWTFDAASRGLDAPLRKVRVSDGWYDNARHAQYEGSRIVVAGKTKVMAFDALTGATATASAPGGLNIVPGVAVPFTVRVTNTGSRADNYSFVVTPPLSTVQAPWTATSAPYVALEPDASGTASFNVTAPLGQAPGTYPVTVEVHAQGYSGRPACGSSSDTIACATLNLTIARSISLALGGPEDKRILRQGAEDTLTFAVTNNGNAEGVVNLTATQTLSRGSPWALRFTPGPQVRIPAGSTVNVNLLLDAPNDAVSGDKNVVTVIAKEGDAATATKSFTAYVDAQFGSEMTSTNNSVELHPGETKTLPVSLRNTGNTEDTYNVTFAFDPPAASNDWRVILDKEVVGVPLGQVRQVGVTIHPLVAEPRDAQLTLKATSQGDPQGSSSTYNVALVAKPAVTTPTGKSSLVPGLAPVWILGLVAVAALARRLGGRR